MLEHYVHYVSDVLYVFYFILRKRSYVLLLFELSAIAVCVNCRPKHLKLTHASHTKTWNEKSTTEISSFITMLNMTFQFKMMPH